MLVRRLRAAMEGLNPGTTVEKARVRKVAWDLLGSLKAKALVIDWRTKQQGRALRGGLREIYAPDEIDQKSDVIYQHVYESYYGAGRSLYGSIDGWRTYA